MRKSSKVHRGHWSVSNWTYRLYRIQGRTTPPCPFETSPIHSLRAYSLAYSIAYIQGPPCSIETSSPQLLLLITFAISLYGNLCLVSYVLISLIDNLMCVRVCDCVIGCACPVLCLLIYSFCFHRLSTFLLHSLDLLSSHIDCCLGIARCNVAVLLLSLSLLQVATPHFPSLASRQFDSQLQ